MGGSEVLGVLFEEEYVCMLHAGKGIKLSGASLQERVDINTVDINHEARDLAECFYRGLILQSQ